ncbi:sensor histidine kinase [Aureivirga sp. CE67]|uniref:sensor histidine kinase n=1 Tax=Aureivirga sp. CE67 TaxID=1788983 RepID=UPI0018CAB5F7|nr:ATP-binding protein [Aureivirga sp. CE67]
MKQFYIKGILQLLIIVFLSIVLQITFQKDYIFSSVAVGLLLIFVGIQFLNWIRGSIFEIEKVIDCMLVDDFSASISDKKQKQPVFKKLQKQLEKNKRNLLLQDVEQEVFQNILENSTTGMLILRRKKGQEIEVFQINNAFTEFLNIPKHFHWKLLQPKIQPILDTIDIENWKEWKKVVTINSHENTEAFHLKTNVTKTLEYEYLVISLETLQQVIDKKEKESWYKLMQVMSHEIINTITPIHSLAENLGDLVEEDTPENKEELQYGLRIIKKRSEYLSEFIDSYRVITELPNPEKEYCSLKELTEESIHLFQKSHPKMEFSLNVEEKIDDVVLIDKKQIEQVLINLFTNSVYATAQKEQAEIKIELRKKRQNLQLLISDNGIGISKDIRDKIFVPYFTTREKGAGIGLTLSKNIMEANQGYIHLLDQEKGTTFMLSFLK